MLVSKFGMVLELQLIILHFDIDMEWGLRLERILGKLMLLAVVPLHMGIYTLDL
jgi:hypothetical protein